MEELQSPPETTFSSTVDTKKAAPDPLVYFCRELKLVPGISLCTKVFIVVRFSDIPSREGSELQVIPLALDVQVSVRASPGQERVLWVRSTEDLRNVIIPC